jgi:galactokinase
MSMFYAPGRTELGGNHTDHNCGKVLAAPVNLRTTASVTERNDNTVVFDSKGFGKTVVNLDSLDVRPEESGTTAALIRGVAAGIARRGGRTGGFDASVSSTVFSGSGLSSSASVEILLGRIFNGLFSNSFSQVELAIIGQEAERTYFGKPCGLMDQIACASSGIVRIDFRNPAEPEITEIDACFEDYGYSLVIVNTGGSHADLTPDYAAIPEEMKTVAAYFGKDNLRSVDRQQFLSELPSLRKSISNDRAVLRAMHFFEENDRVDKMVLALQNGNFERYLEIVDECGKSSLSMLQNAYSPSHPLNQEITLALSLTDNLLGKKASCRLQGGGFAGTIQAYVPHDSVAAYRQEMERVFGEGSSVLITLGG